MALTIETAQGRLEISDVQLRAVADHARQRADLTAAALDATGIFTTKPAHLPAGFLLELGAVLELGLWERNGLRQFLATDLPSFHDAAAELAARASKGPKEFDGSDAAPLSQRVLRYWIEHFAWDGPRHLRADVVLGPVDEDQFADLMADFVWQHRHELSQLLAPESTEHLRESS